MGCSTNEDQRHSFEKCDVLNTNLYMNNCEFICKDSEEQKQTIYSFFITEEKRKQDRNLTYRCVLGITPFSINLVVKLE